MQQNRSSTTFSGTSQDWLDLRVVQDGDGSLHLTAVGELDRGSAGRFHRTVGNHLREPLPATIRLDLSGVEFLDSGGIRCLMSCHHDAHAAGVAFIVETVSPVAHQVLRITGLLEILGLPAHPSPPAAGRSPSA